MLLRTGLCVLLAACGQRVESSEVRPQRQDDGGALGEADAEANVAADAGPDAAESEHALCGAAVVAAAVTSVSALEQFLETDHWAWSTCAGEPNPLCPVTEPLLLFQHEGEALFMRCGHFCDGHSSSLCADRSGEQHPAELVSDVEGFAIATGFDDLAWRYQVRTWSSESGAILQLVRGNEVATFQAAPHYVQ